MTTTNDAITNEPPLSFPSRAWRLTYPYWQSEEKVRAWGLLILILVLNLFGVYLLYRLNQWNQAFYDALQEKNAKEFWKQIWVFCTIAAFWVLTAVYKAYVAQVLQMRWRNWLNKHFLDRWLKDKTYYRMELARSETDNPDQRIAEDLNKYTNGTLLLGIGLLNATVTLVTFVGVLWGLSGPLVFSIGTNAITIPGYMVWGCILYALAGSLITHWIGRQLIPINFKQQRLEADFRFDLVRLRESSEEVALYEGEPSERKHLFGRFDAVMDNFWRLIKVNKRLGWFTFSFGQAAVIFPFFLAGSRYFSGAITLGMLMQISSAFGRVQDALSWFVDNYSAVDKNDSLVTWRATADRLLQFQAAMDRAEHQATGVAIETSSSPDQSLQVDDLTVALPNGAALVNAAKLAINPGEKVLLTGASGSGKSTLFRALAGIWPFGHGQVRRPDGKRILFLPQKPYLPIGSLRETVSYPGKPGEFADAAIIDALRACKLEALTSRLDEQQHWGQQLSPGEQQRVAFARALLHKPDWLFMDEATSALDEATEQEMYRLLSEHLPQSTFVSIAHRPNVAAFHTRQITIAPGADGAMSLKPA
jgi:vitamin B12/bleomycin/antimicrobial peptide transport system ATP-binding/permease protein